MSYGSGYFSNIYSNSENVVIHRVSNANYDVDDIFYKQKWTNPVLIFGHENGHICIIVWLYSSNLYLYFRLK